MQLKRALNLAVGTLQTATAISAELVPVETDARTRFMRDPESVNEGNNNFEYAIALVEVLAGQMNPAGIPGLIEVVDFGLPPQRPLVDFGEAAAPALAELAANGRSGAD